VSFILIEKSENCHGEPIVSDSRTANHEMLNFDMQPNREVKACLRHNDPLPNENDALNSILIFTLPKKEMSW